MSASRSMDEVLHVLETLVRAAEPINYLIAEDDAIYEEWVQEADALEDALQKAENLLDEMDGLDIMEIES